MDSVTPQTAGGDHGNRLDRLTARAEKTVDTFNQGYSRFVRWLRVLFPLAALGIVVLLLAWPDMEDTVMPEMKKPGQDKTVGQNELIKPRFESKDRRDQPFTVTAAKARQSENNSDLVLLDQPEADMTMKDGAWLAAQALKGTYSQKGETLSLKGDVKLFHDLGYEMLMDRLDVDLNAQTARCDTPVKGQGPVGTLQARNMQADMGKGTLIFGGPVKLVLSRSVRSSQ